MLRKVLLIIAVLAGGLIGLGAAWVFHLIIGRDLGFLTAHPRLLSIVGAGFLVMLAKAVYETKLRRPVAYGLFALGIGSGIALHAIGNLPLNSSDNIHTDLLLRLAAALVLMVNGFGSLSRDPEPSGVVPQDTSRKILLHGSS
jgi:hypothetical protein